VSCWLVNTGWTGGKYGIGQRMPINVTRRLLTAALDGTLKQGEFFIDPYFGFQVPAEVKGVDSRLLKPRETWSDNQQFDITVHKLLQMFRENFAKFENAVDEEVRAAALMTEPRVLIRRPQF
jgi:phosphoenolpyruvate carboxykinase (ATP)